MTLNSKDLHFLFGDFPKEVFILIRGSDYFDIYDLSCCNWTVLVAFLMAVLSSRTSLMPPKKLSKIDRCTRGFQTSIDQSKISRPQTLIEKIVQKFVAKEEKSRKNVVAGDYVQGIYFYQFWGRLNSLWYNSLFHFFNSNNVLKVTVRKLNLVDCWLTSHFLQKNDSVWTL